MKFAISCQHKIFFVCALAALCVLWRTAPIEAAVNISVNPIDGSNSIRLDRIEGQLPITKQVRIRLTSTVGKQYQVFQRLTEPLTNEKGTTLDSRAVQTSSLAGSNSFGTLYVQNVENLGMTDQLLYTSAASGDGDTFTMLYAVNPDQVNASGNFMGRIIYTIRPIGDSSQDQAIVTIYLNASGNFTVDVRGSRTPNAVRLEDRETENPDEIAFSFKGNVGGDVKVYQEMDVSPQNESLEELKKDALFFATTGSQSQGLLYPNPTALDRGRAMIYQSNKSEDAWVVHFSLDREKIVKLKAGTYRGKLKYDVEAGDDKREFVFDLEVTINPIFKLDVQLPPEGMKFGKVLPNTPPQEKEVIVSVRTNLGKPYMVVQKVDSLLANDKGGQIPKQYFTFRTERIVSKSGKLLYAGFNPVDAGEVPVYFSDSKGSSTQFKVLYRLKSYPEIAPGDYSVPIMFSLGEI